MKQLLGSSKRQNVYLRNLTALMLPIALQNLMNASLALADTFMIGNLPDAEQALAAVNQANALYFIFMLFTFGVQSGTSVFFSQYWGKQDAGAMNRVLGLGWMTAGSVMLAVCTFLIAAPGMALSITTDDPEIIALGAEYIQIAAPAFFLNTISMIYIGAQRCMGNARFGMLTIGSSMLLNTMLNYILIYGHFGFPAMGVKGAAAALLIARTVEIIIVAVYALRTKRLRLKPRLIFHPGKLMWKDFKRHAAPIIINETLWGFGFSCYAFILGRIPNPAAGLAAYAVSHSLFRIASAFIFGMGNAGGILIGQAIGEGKNTEDVKAFGLRLTWWSFLMGAATTAVFALLLLVFIPVLLPMFKIEAEAEALTHSMLFMSVIMMPVRAVNVTLIVGILRNGGDGRAGAVIEIFTLYLIGLPLAAVAGLHFAAGALWIVIISNIEECVKLALVLWRLYRFKWVRSLTRESELQI
jgi:putative MATE family efflux protein